MKNIVAKFIKNNDDASYKLVITHNKQGLRGMLSDIKNNRISAANFYECHGDADVYRVKEYYGFNDNNSYQIK